MIFLRNNWLYYAIRFVLGKLKNRPSLLLRVIKNGYVKKRYEKNLYIGPLLDRDREGVGQRQIPTARIVQTGG
jgi:hypothetical protein